jgi:hypothetical protein
MIEFLSTSSNDPRVMNGELSDELRNNLRDIVKIEKVQDAANPGWNLTYNGDLGDG